MMTIRQARRFRDLTQAETAKKLNMNIDTYRRIEQNPQKATVETAKRLCVIFNMGIDEIFFGEQSTKSRDCG